MSKIFHVEEVELHEPIVIQYGSTENPIMEVRNFQDWGLKDKANFLSGLQTSERRESLRKAGKSERDLTTSEAIQIITMARTVAMNMNEEARNYFDTLPQQAQVNIAKSFLEATKDEATTEG